MARTFCPGGVRFDGSTLVKIASLVATDNQMASASMWFSVESIVGPDIQALYLSKYPTFQSPDRSIELYGRTAGRDPSIAASFNTGTSDPDPDSSVLFTESARFGFVTQMTWHHVLASGATSGSGAIKMYLDGVDFGDTPDISLGPELTMPWNGNELFVGASHDLPDDYAFIGSMAEVWIAPGQSLLDGSGVIPPATIAKFYNSGCPVDLGSDGSTPTGTAPAVYFSRANGDPAADWGVNRGTGGTATIVGALTAVDHICACGDPLAGNARNALVGLIPGTVGI